MRIRHISAFPNGSSLSLSLSVSVSPFFLLFPLVLACGSGPLPPLQEPSVDPRTTSPEPSVAASPSEPGDAGAQASTSLQFGKDLDEGLKTEDLHVGFGPSVQMGHIARVHYKGTLVSGREFDNSKNRGAPLEFTLGKSMVIAGFERGMVGMRVGGVRRISIPWALGYGERGSPPAIPPKSDLVFEIELLDLPVPPPKAAKPKQAPGGASMGGAPPQ